MASIDIFNNDAFSLTELTQAINDGPYVPGRLGQLGWFSEQGIRTLTVAVERKNNVLTLVPTMARGAPATPKGVQKANIRDVRAVHLPQRAAVMADEVQGIRAFGSETELKAVQDLVNEKLAVMRQDIDITFEYQRVGAMKGIVYDADGTTELFDFFDLFGLTQVTHSMELDQTTTDVRVECHKAKRKMEAKLGMKPYRSMRAVCSASFFDALVSNADVKSAWDRWQDGGWLREDLSAGQGGTGGFAYGGIYWEEYRGGINGTDFIEADTAYLVPEGVPNLFKTYFAPADYMETVNTKGLPYYAKQEPMPMNKGVELESQSNPLHLCHQPDAIIKLTKT